MIGGVDLSSLRNGAGGLAPLVVTPQQADLNLRRGVMPDGKPAVYLTLSPKGWPMQLLMPVPAEAWEQLVAGLGSAEAPS